MESKTIFTFMDNGTLPPVPVGKLFIDCGKARETYSFEYDESWLSSPKRFAIDPELPLFRGRQYPMAQKLFGAFQDASPDRWGRTLLQRKERILAVRNKRKPRKLLDSDFLLGICDESRMGAIRLSLGMNEPFLSPGDEMSIPPFMALRKLEAASRAFENDESQLEEQWVKTASLPRLLAGRRKTQGHRQGFRGCFMVGQIPIPP